MFSCSCVSCPSSHKSLYSIYPSDHTTVTMSAPPSYTSRSSHDKNQPSVLKHIKYAAKSGWSGLKKLDVQRQLVRAEKRLEVHEKDKIKIYDAEKSRLEEERKQYPDEKSQEYRDYTSAINYIYSEKEKFSPSQWSEKFKEYRNWRRGLLWEIAVQKQEQKKHEANKEKRDHHQKAYVIPGKARESTITAASASHSGASAVRARPSSSRASPNEHAHAHAHH